MTKYNISHWRSPGLKFKEYQFIWWGWVWAMDWPFYGFKRLRKKETSLAYIYVWIFVFGPFEIRKWTKQWEPK